MLSDLKMAQPLLNVNFIQLDQLWNKYDVFYLYSTWSIVSKKVDMKTKFATSEDGA